MTVSWYPCKLLNESSPVQPYAVIVLNQPINKNALNAVIEKASLLVCADAGAKQLFLYDQQKGLRQRLPDAIVGDLDSVTRDVVEHYEAKGAQVVQDTDQYSTDFTKCLKWIRKTWNGRESESSMLDVVVLGGLGGRVDQGFSQMHHLYLALKHKDLLFGRIYLLSEQSLSFVLDTDRNEIYLEPGIFEENIGIIPVAGPTSITTSGLEWDVEDWHTEFGGQISTSNHLRSDLVTVEVHGKQPLFTLELNKDFASAGK